MTEVPIRSFDFYFRYVFEAQFFRPEDKICGKNVDITFCRAARSEKRKFPFVKYFTTLFRFVRYNRFQMSLDNFLPERFIWKLKKAKIQHRKRSNSQLFHFLKISKLDGFGENPVFPSNLRLCLVIGLLWSLERFNSKHPLSFAYIEATKSAYSRMNYFEKEISPKQIFSQYVRMNPLQKMYPGGFR